MELWIGFIWLRKGMNGGHVLIR